jgi:hypothetical protein
MRMMLPLLAAFALHTAADEPMPLEMQSQSDAIVVPAAAAGGAVVGYTLGFVVNLTAMNGSNPINSLVQHPGEPVFEQAGLVIAPVLVFPSTAIAAWIAGARYPVAIGLVTGGATLVAHGAVLAMSPLLRDILDPAFGEAGVLVVVGAFTASVAAGAAFVDAAGPTLLDE